VLTVLAFGGGQAIFNSMPASASFAVTVYHVPPPTAPRNQPYAVAAVITSTCAPVGSGSMPSTASCSAITAVLKYTVAGKIVTASQTVPASGAVVWTVPAAAMSGASFAYSIGASQEYCYSSGCGYYCQMASGAGGPYTVPLR